MGVRQFQLIDFDQVDWPNVAAQGFATSDVGQAKVHAVAGSLFQFDPTLHVDVVRDRWRPKHFVHDVVFSCVDSITARSAIWNGVGSSRSFWGDARMLGEVIRILTATDPDSRDHYRSTLFDASQAQQGSCTARSTIYTASIAAGLLVHQWVEWMRSGRSVGDILINLSPLDVSLLDS
jgi:sulfur carrier protein ThiS adenylyltransferase